MKYQSLIENMTLEEKASLMSGKDFWQTKNLDKHNIPSIFFADGPHGIRKQAIGADHLGLNQSLKATCFPTASTMACSWNVELAKKLGEKLGREAISQKVNVLLGPGVNIKRNPRCGRNFEYFSEDPYLAGKMAKNYIQGIQSQGISACVKHFALNNQEYRRMANNSVVDKRTMHEIYLTPFEMAIKEAQSKAIMTSYNLVNGVYANENKYLLRDVLRNDWNYEGVVVTDWGGNNDRVAALEAGSDLEMPTTNGETNELIIETIKNGYIDEQYLDESVDRLLTLIHDTSSVYDKEIPHFDIDEHHNFARMAAEDSIVLLKNNNNLLPLESGTKVAIVGDFSSTPRYQGAGSSIVNPTRLESTLDLINQTKLDLVGYEKGFNRYGKKSKKLIDKAVKLSKSAEVILLYLGLDEVTELEGMDRDNINLPQNQIDLVNSLVMLEIPIVVVLSYGSVVEMPYINDVSAIVHGYLSGQASSEAILNVLTGKVNPSGKLAETIANHYNDYPTSENYPGKVLTAEYREGLYIGYRFFDKNSIKPLYPFGYGLSYTTFKYSNLHVGNNEIVFRIKNIGKVEGKEIAQLYVAKKQPSFFRAAKELKGFIKVALKPGEIKTVTIPFDEYTFRYYNVMTNQFEVEAGEYELMVGASSRDIRLIGSIIKPGTTLNLPYKDVKLPKYISGDIKAVSNEEFRELLGFEIPDSGRFFYKKNRLIATENTVIEDLRYARGWFGRFIAWTIRTLLSLLRFVGKRETAAVLSMGLLQLPLRGVSRMSGGLVSWEQLQALKLMINGHFFKGAHQFFRALYLKRKRQRS